MRYARQAAVAVLLISALAGSATAKTQNLDKYWERCENAGDFSATQVIDACTTIIQSMTEDASGMAIAYYNRGLTHDIEGDTALAAADYGAVIELEPDNAYALESRAMALRTLGDGPGAIADLDALIALDPTSANAYYNRGNAKASMRDYAGAVTDYGLTLQIDPDHARALNNRGSAHHMMREYEAAYADFNRAVELDPEYPAALGNRCRASAVLGRNLEQAAADCSQSLALRPDDPLTLDARGLVYLLRQDFSAAFADYDAAVMINDMLYGSLYGRGIAQLRLGRTEAGEMDIAAAVQADPAVPGVYERSGIRP